MPKTLLLADDSVTIQKVVGITFANEDVELVTVDNGDDALTRAREVKPDLVLADIGMPGLNGYELCAAIRRDPNLSHVPVLLLTGTFETYDEARAREVGASGHIAKPFEAQALVDRVFQLLAQTKPAPAPQPKPAAAPPRPAPAAAQSPAQSLPPRPAAPPAATPRPRPELPPVPHAPSAKTAPAPAAPAPKPAPAPAAAAPASPPTVPAPPKRESTPFEFELPDPPAKPAAAPAAQAKAAPAVAPRPAPPVDQEPIWEAEPEADVLADDPSLQATHAEPVAHATPVPQPHAPPAASSQDATRLFAPDLLGRATQLPDVPEPPRPPARKGDFSFDDLSFEEPTNPQAHQSGIFGEASDGSHEFEPEFAQPIPEPPLEVEALADPLYSQTTFLDPASRPGAPAAPPLPDLLATPQPRPAPTFEAESDGELDLAEADTALEDEAETPVPFAQPFSADTAAAFEKPSFARAPEKPARPAAPDAATRLVLPDETETPVPTRLTAPTPPRVAPGAAAEADTLPPAARRAPAPAAPRTSAVVDSALLAQSVEKVAWEAFGALSEQVVGEVLKRVEAVVWEVVPQLCERLIREEIARLKAEMSE
jgi:CheY-like chemotaxis protein